MYKPNLAETSKPLAVGAFKVIPQTFGNRPVTILVSSVAPETAPYVSAPKPIVPPECVGTASPLFFMMKAFAAPSKETSQPS